MSKFVDRADEILRELLARKGQKTRAQLREQALDQLPLFNEKPSTPSGRSMLKDLMIAAAARDDAEADRLLALRWAKVA